MIFYAIFWTTYLPFVVLTLSLLADRLTHHTESDAADADKAGSRPCEAFGPRAQGRRRGQVTCGQVTAAK